MPAQPKESAGQYIYELMASNDTSSTLHPEWRDLTPADQVMWEHKAEEVLKLLLERRQHQEEEQES